MEKKAMGLCVLALGLLGFVSSALAASNDIHCDRARVSLMPCIFYLAGDEPTPAPSCCEGLGRVLSETTSTQDRRNMCLCLKFASIGLRVKGDRGTTIGPLCDVKLPAPLDPTTNCSSIQV